MPGLLEQQQAFLRHLLDPEDGTVLGQVISDRLSARQRLAIHRNNTFITLRESLAALYPVVQRLVGEAFFADLARGFVAAHPSRSGNLHDFGARLSDYVRQEPRLASLPYLGDVAALEWAWHVAYHGPHAEPMDLARLSAVPGERFAQLRLVLHPGASVLASRFPVLTIWKAHQVPDPPVVDLDAGGEQVLVIRPALEVELHGLGAADYRFLDACAGGATLEQAAEAVLAGDAAFDLQESLLGFFAAGLITGVTLDAASAAVEPGSLNTPSGAH